MAIKGLSPCLGEKSKSNPIYMFASITTGSILLKEKLQAQQNSSNQTYKANAQRKNENNVPFKIEAYKQ